MKILSGEVYLSTEKFAAAVDCHPETIRQKCRRHEIPGATKLASGRGGRWKIPASSIHAFVQGTGFRGGDAA